MTNLKILETFNASFVKRLMPQASKIYIDRYYYLVYFALEERKLDYKEMMLMALATISAEAGDFDITVREYVSKYNTTPEARSQGHYFDMYDNREDLGNKGKPDGFSYRGGGAIQLTGRYNYREIGIALGLPLEDKPELIEHPIVSARALALFLKRKQPAIDSALVANDYAKARRLVNGGSHGLDEFTRTYLNGREMLKGVEF